MSIALGFSSESNIFRGRRVKDMADLSESQSTKALVASLIGSSIEWYDYLLYGTVAPRAIALKVER